MSDQLIETLEAKAGNRFDETGECIATYGRYNLVFMPKGVKPGQNARVRLEEVREDRRGRMMYRGVPANDEYTERWKDNGDGTASRVTIEIDWLLVESEVGVVEARELETKEEHYTTRTERKPVLGQSLTDSHVEEVKVEVYHTKNEVVRNGGLVWEKTGEREERGTPENLPATKVTAGEGNWGYHKLDAAYGNDLTIRVRAYYGDGSYDYAHEDTTWGNLPKWVQDLTSADYPVCVCGRSRRDVNVSDGYGKCETCRTEETCDRCGEQKKVTNIEGRLICNDCKKYEEQELLIGAKLTAEHLAAIAQEAQSLITVDPIEGELAEMVLTSGLDFIESSWDRERQLEREKGYRWYYFTPHGVFATKLEKSALEILQFVASATGNPLVDMVSWFAEGVKPSEYDVRYDYYLRTQVEGETGVDPKVTEADLEKMVRKLKAGESVLADNLRGSDEDRAKLEEWLEANADRYQGYTDSYGRKEALVEAVQKATQSVKGYHSALQKIAEFEEWVTARQVQQKAGEIWMDVIVQTSTESRTYDRSWCITPEGELVEPREDETGGRRSRVYAHVYGDIPQTHIVVSHSHDNYGYRKSESWTVHRLPVTVTPAQKAKLEELGQECHEYFRGAGTGWDLSKEGYVSFTTVYSRDLTGSDQEAYESMCAEMPINVVEYELHYNGDPVDNMHLNEDNPPIVVGPYKKRDPRQRKLNELRDQLEELQYQLQGLEMTKEYETEEYEQAELGAVERLDANYGTRPVSDGDIFEATFTEEEHRGETRMSAGPFWDDPSGSWVKLVGNPYHGSQVEAGVRYLVKVEARNSEQTQLFAYMTDNPRGKHGPGGRKVRVYGYFAIPVLGPQDYDREIEEARNRIAELEAEIAQLESDITENPPTLNPKQSAVQSEDEPVWIEKDEDDGTMTAMEHALRKAMRQAQKEE